MVIEDMSERQGRSFLDDLKRSMKKPFETRKEKPEKPTTQTITPTLNVKITTRDLKDKEQKKFDEHLMQQMEFYMTNNTLYTSEGLRRFIQHVTESRNLDLKGLRYGCLEVLLQCPTLESLEGLWKDYRSGHLNEVAERYLVTDDIKKELNLETVRLKTIITEENYLICKEALMENSYLKEEDPSASPTEQEKLSKMIAHLSIASAAPTTPASSTEQETLSGLLEHSEEDDPLVIQLHESSQGRVHDQKSVVPESGYVLMINNYDFPQNQGYLDLYNEFKKFGFRTRRDELLTKSEMLKAVKDTAERDFSSDDCFVCVIVSHGSKDEIYGTDNKAINLGAIAKLFSSDKCLSLYGKPKIFLIEACQESQTNEGPDSVPLPPPVISEDDLGDFLICHASTSPHIKFPNNKYRSRKERPIYSVAQELKSKSTVEIEMIMTSPSMQQWQLVSKLTKKVIFQKKNVALGSNCTLQ